MQNKIHEVQAEILKELLLIPKTNFASLNVLKLDNNHFNFHLKKLVSDGLIEKSNNKYYLTQKGKEVASKLDIDFLRFERQGGPSVVVTARKIINKRECFLVHKRLKEPFWGHFGFVNGKIRFGETTKAAAQRELYEESGIKGDLTLLGVRHVLTGPSKKKIKLDNYFFMYIVKDPIGKVRNTREGENYWIEKEKILKLDLIPGLGQMVKDVTSGKYQKYKEFFIALNNI